MCSIFLFFVSGAGVPAHKFSTKQKSKESEVYVAAQIIKITKEYRVVFSLPVCLFVCCFFLNFFLVSVFVCPVF